MKNKKLSAVKLFALGLAAILTIVTMLRAAAWSLDAGTLIFMLWGVSPFLCFLAITNLLARFTRLPQIPLIACVISVLMLAFTLVGYIGTLGDTSSTYALIFLFVPLWLYIGSIVLLTISVVVTWLTNRAGPTA